MAVAHVSMIATDPEEVCSSRMHAPPIVALGQWRKVPGPRFRFSTEGEAQSIRDSLSKRITFARGLQLA